MLNSEIFFIVWKNQQKLVSEHFDLLIVCNISIYSRMLAVEMELISQY